MNILKYTLPVVMLFVCTLTACSGPTNPSPRSVISSAATAKSVTPPTATKPVASPSSSVPVSTPSAPTPTQVPTQVDLTSPEKAVTAMLNAYNAKDVRGIIAASVPSTLDATAVTNLTAAAKLGNPGPYLSNIKVIQNEKSFFDDDKHAARKITFTFVEGNVADKADFDVFQDKSTKLWQVFGSPLSGINTDLPDGYGDGPTKIYALVGDKKILVQDNSLLYGLFPGTYKFEQVGPGKYDKIQTQTITFRESNF